jgi:dihydroorotate dehydrogenase (fumarate)
MTYAFRQPFLNVVLSEVLRWMEEHEYASIDQMRGSMSQRNVPDPAPYERANYMRVLSPYALCSANRDS